MNLLTSSYEVTLAGKRHCSERSERAGSRLLGRMGERDCRWRVRGLEFCEGGEDADFGGFGLGGAVEVDAGEHVEGFAGDRMRRLSA